MKHEQTPIVTTLVNGKHVDISYACEFDHGTKTIELPNNLPGGSEVFVDGEYLCTTAIALEERAKHMRNMSRRPFRTNLLSAAIGAALYR
jgi:hypothetical protein